MYKLLNAGFSRLKKNKLFWFLIILVIGVSLLVVGEEYIDMVKHNEVIKTEQIIFLFSPYVGILIAVFVSFFLGREYSDGTIRNKVVVGHKRKDIYLSNVIINTVVSIIIYLVYLFVVSILSIPLFGGIQMSLLLFVIQLFDIIISIGVYSSILSFIAVLCSNKTITSVLCIFTILGLIIVCLNILNIVLAPETILVGQIANDETNEVEFITQPNPDYPSEFKKAVCMTILDIIPTGQAIEIVAGLETNYTILSLYSLGLIIIFNGIGLYLFNKKELN